MKKIKGIVSSFLVLSLLAVVSFAAPASADNQNSSANVNAFMNAEASIRSSASARLENSSGVVMGANNTLFAMNAKVVSVTGADVNATVPFGNSSLSFVVKTDAETKINGKLVANATTLGQLKAGDKISFSGTVTSSTSSSIVVDADRLVSRTFSNITAETSWNGTVSAVNTADSSFTLKLKNGVNVKVLVTNSTPIMVDGTAGTLASLLIGDEVKITGQLNSEGNIITATKISADRQTGDQNDDKKEVGKKNNDGKFWGKFMGWLWK